MMTYRKTPEIKTAANNIVARMHAITQYKFVFTWVLDSNGIDFISDDYYAFQDDGVRGTESGSSKGNYQYKSKMPPPSAFSKYSSDLNVQFAIAKSIQQEGNKAHNYTDKIKKDAFIFSELEIIYAELALQNI